MAFSAGGGSDVVECFNVNSDQLDLVNLDETQISVTAYDDGTLVLADTGESIFLIDVCGIGIEDLNFA